MDIQADNKKNYVIFDVERDLEIYQSVKNWSKNDESSFNFYDSYELANQLDIIPDEKLKLEIQERINLADVVIILIGSGTKSMRRFVKWQIEQAIAIKLPIIAININNIKSVDYDRCPTILKSSLSIHIGFSSKVLEYALDEWPSIHSNLVQKEKKGTYKYEIELYKKLNVTTQDE